jgi:hypothetical protein
LQLYQENINLQEVLVRESKGGGSAKNTSKVIKPGGTTNSIMGAILNQAGATLITNNSSEAKKAGNSVEGGASFSQASLS